VVKNLFLFIFFLNLFLVSQFVYSEDSQIIINKIIIEGNQRVTDDTVLSYSDISEGDVFTSQIGRRIIKDLYETGYFDDVSLNIEGNILTIKFKEKPIISIINIIDNKIVEDDDIFTALDNVGISRARPFDKNIFDKIEQELTRLYFDRGRYNAKISSKVTTLERNRVAIDLIIKEGDASRIRKINFIGNKNFSSDKLRELMQLGTKYFFEFWSDRDTYSGSLLQADMAKIEEYYFNRGFIRFRILSNQVNLSNNNEDILITISLEEGEKYEFGDLKVFGNQVLNESILKSEISRILQPGQIFSREKIQQSEILIKNMLGEEGYAFPNVAAIPVIDDETQIVDIDYRLSIGKKSIVRRITIAGNTGTNDEVYRRELRQYESSLHKQSSIDRSKIRLQRLKYVDDVEIIKTKVVDTDDMIDITFKIKERKAGEFRISAGWSDTDGAIFDIDLKQDNFLGGGNNVAIKASRSSVQNTLRVFLTDPYFTTDGVSKTTNILLSQTDVSNTSTATYLSDTLGFGVLYNIPISETQSYGYGIDLNLTRFTTTIGSPIIVTHHLNDHGSNAIGVNLSASYTSDTRNRTRFAETGVLNLFQADLFLALDGASYLTTKYDAELNYPYTLKTFGFDWNTVFQIKSIIGFGVGVNGATSLPFYTKFFAGGNTTVRGFKGASLGPFTYNAPRSDTTCAAKAIPGKFIKCDTVGGDFITAAQFDWLFPPPDFLTEDTRGVRASLFVDVGNVFEKVNDFDYNDLRASYGIQFNALTPIGSVSVGFANALRDKEGDDFQSVIFRLGGNF
tara:strand:- start:5811 stop:8192 length:2382 start_codon:yes stop_codon:yes gene_type:complete